ncbi:TrbL/VirB6 family protein [Rickettsiales endosymbiont of Stachyamoeba lipophora]|uniref:type IV secretion system protein n=1 Tax=Rickettsiales endosymbiont of Stachyamoeba lipophora TaxID=2486578 RepID=UPI0013DDB81F|nr:type IV secretion system protein [Rickettsiales endosymbiont of Stachyamoeba lipophora]
MLRTIIVAFLILLLNGCGDSYYCSNKQDFNTQELTPYRFTTIVRGDGVIAKDYHEFNDLNYNSSYQGSNNVATFGWQKDWFGKPIGAKHEVEIKVNGKVYRKKGSENAQIYTDKCAGNGAIPIIGEEKYNYFSPPLKKGDFVVVSIDDSYTGEPLVNICNHGSGVNIRKPHEATNYIMPYPNTHSFGRYINTFLTSVDNPPPSVFKACRYNDYGSWDSNNLGLSDFNNLDDDTKICYYQGGKGVRIAYLKDYQSDTIKSSLAPFLSLYSAEQPITAEKYPNAFHQFIMDRDEIIYIGASHFVLHDSYQRMIYDYMFKFNYFTDIDHTLSNLKIVFSEKHPGEQSTSEPNDVKTITKNSKFVTTTPGNLWFKVDNSAYQNQAFLDHYYVEVIVKPISINVQNGIGSWLNDKIMKPIQESLTEGAATTYNRILGNTNVIAIIKTMMVLYVVSYGLLFVMGYIQETQRDIVLRIFKISFITILISDKSWQFFFDNLFSIFFLGTDNLLSMITNSEPNNPFGFIDYTFNKYLKALPFVILSLLQYILIYSFFGVLLLVLIGFAFYKILISIVNIIAVYLINMILIAFLVALAPIFLSFIMFAQTKKLFDEWIKTLIYLVFNPVLLIIVLLVMTEIIDIFASPLLVVEFCLNPLFILNYNILGIDLFSFTIPWFVPSGFSPIVINFNTNGTLFDELLEFFKHTFRSYYSLYVNAFMLFIMVKLLEKVLEFTSTLSLALLGDSLGKAGSLNTFAKASGFIGGIIKHILNLVDTAFNAIKSVIS